MLDFSISFSWATLARKYPFSGVRSVPTMESATWCRTSAAASAARRLRPELCKNSSTALSSNEGELARSITTRHRRRGPSNDSAVECDVTHQTAARPQNERHGHPSLVQATVKALNRSMPPSRFRRVARDPGSPYRRSWRSPRLPNEHAWPPHSRDPGASRSVPSPYPPPSALRQVRCQRADSSQASRRTYQLPIDAYQGRRCATVSRRSDSQLVTWSPLPCRPVGTMPSGRQAPPPCVLQHPCRASR